ncbi:MAG: CHRD domain-containing protein [Burkholderiales bacterium]
MRTFIETFPRPGALLVVVALAAVGSSAALAKNVVVQLNGKNEVPPVTTSATGQGTLTINDDKTVSGSITTTGVSGTAAHIHTGAQGKNGPVSVPLTKSGDAGWSVPAGAKLSDDQYKAFQTGELYVNVHSAAHPDGEIRAQLKP